VAVTNSRALRARRLAVANRRWQARRLRSRRLGDDVTSFHSLRPLPDPARFTARRADFGRPKEADTSGAGGYDAEDRSLLLGFLGEHRVLDGCASGALGAELMVRGYSQVVGIEPRPEAAERARRRLSEVIVGSFPEVVCASLGQFDLVVFADCLEHMVDPWTALRVARGLLSPNGVILLSVPNVSHWSVLWPALRLGRWDYVDAGLLDRTHLRFFTPATVAEALDAAGLQTVARMGFELPTRRWLRPIIRRVCPHVLVFQEYVIAVPTESAGLGK
jgi:2-polyprenyl-3-methyl-5-hydroxy-6-metoxy-1,4-benzoquinol methylase